MSMLSAVCIAVSHYRGHNHRLGGLPPVDTVCFAASSDGVYCTMRAEQSGHGSRLP